MSDLRPSKPLAGGSSPSRRTETLTPAQQLRAAAEVIRRDGWAQGWKVCIGPHGPCCPVIALNRVERDRENWSVNRACLRRVIDRFDDGGIIAWNDTPGRTVDEVLAALESAAVLAETGAAK